MAEDQTGLDDRSNEWLRKSRNINRVKSPADPPLSVQRTQGGGSLISGRWKREG